MDEIQRLIEDLGKIPPDLRKELRPGLRKAAKPVLDQARKNASWSTRIPRATRISISFGSRNPGVRIVTSAKQAPHAKPYEFGSQRAASGWLRHPVFGNREVWVNQKTRPFQEPALRTKGGAAVKEIADVVDRVTRHAGFR